MNNEKQNVAEILNDTYQYQSYTLADSTKNNMLFMDIDTSMVQDVVITNQPIHEVKMPLLGRKFLTFIPFVFIQLNTSIILNNCLLLTASGKPKRNRTNFTPEQLTSLENHFFKTPYLNRAKRIQISKELNLQERQVKIWFQNRRMKLKRETQKEKSEKKKIQSINNSDGESRSSSTISALFNSNACGSPNDREICQNLMKYQNYGLETKFEMKQEPYYSNGVAQVEFPHSDNGQPMQVINNNHWVHNPQITAQQQWQPAQFQMKEENVYPTATSQIYSEFDIHESFVSNNVHNVDFDENFQFDAPVFQIL